VNRQPLPSGDVTARPADPDVALLIDRWPTLPDPTKEAIVSLVTNGSRKGNCWDNAPTKSLIATLKKELVHQQRYTTRGAARQPLFEYFEVFDNRQRRQFALGYRTPGLRSPLAKEQQR
jgi:hypothetical protein